MPLRPKSPRRGFRSPETPIQERNNDRGTDLAMFRCYFCKGLLHIPEVKQVLLSELTWAEAKAFIRQVEAPEWSF